MHDAEMVFYFNRICGGVGLTLGRENSPEVQKKTTIIAKAYGK